MRAVGAAKAIGIALVALLAASPALAQYAAVAYPGVSNGDAAWLLAASLIVLLGVGGLVLRQSALPVIAARDIATPHAIQAATLTLLWVAFGYSIAFAEGFPFIGGLSQVLLAELSIAAPGAAAPESAFVLFQLAVLLFAAATLAGIWIGRARFGWALLFVGLWVAIVYLPLVRWMTAAGWLAGLGAIDYAGGATLHLAVGVSAFVLARVIRPATTQPRPIGGAAQAGAALGWIALLAITGGAALAADDTASSALLNAQIAAASGALAWFLSGQVRSGRRSPRGALGGGIAGLAAIAAGAGFVAPGAAVLIGALAGALGFQAARHLAGRIDDPLDIVATHGLGGLIGLLLAAAFTFPPLGGIGFDDHTGFLGLFAAQAGAAVVTILWAGFGSWSIARLAALIWPLRPTE